MGIFSIVLTICLATEVSGFTVNYEILSKLYLPYTYSPTALYKPKMDAAEQLAYDPKVKLLYSVGYTNIHIINLTDVRHMEVLYHSSSENVDVTDVEICGNFLFVSSDNKLDREKGFVDVFRLYNTENRTLELVQHIIVGDLPDMIHPTSDCTKLIVALEAEPYDDDATRSLIDNPGAVIIISFSGTPADNYTIKSLGFQEFDSRFPDLEKTGVRHIYKGVNNSNPFSNDVEPEYIAFNKEETKAYISLQENNAIAVVDLVQERIENIFGLGFKDWGDKNLDVSDKDNSINLRPWKVYGMYQPDSIKVYRHNGADYIITSNEGDSKDYKYFTEEHRVKDYGLSELFESNATLRRMMDDDDALGRLKVTTVNGFNETTQTFDSLYTYGGRSFSIWRADTMTQVYDSGSEIAQKISLLKPSLFNNDLVPGGEPVKTFDSRSDDKGPETESVVMGTFGTRTLLFIGNERPGIIAVYSIDERLPEVKPKFETLITDIPRTNDTWDNLYAQHALSMIDCEDMRFIPAMDSPNGQPLLIVSGSVSGTITLVNINTFDSQADSTPNSGSTMSSYIGLILTCIVVCVTRHVSVRG